MAAVAIPTAGSTCSVRVVSRVAQIASRCGLGDLSARQGFQDMRAGLKHRTVARKDKNANTNTYLKTSSFLKQHCSCCKDSGACSTVPLVDFALVDLGAPGRRANGVAGASYDSEDEETDNDLKLLGGGPETDEVNWVDAVDLLPSAGAANAVAVVSLVVRDGDDAGRNIVSNYSNEKSYEAILFEDCIVFAMGGEWCV